MSTRLPADWRRWWPPTETTCFYGLDPVQLDQVAVNWSARLGCHLIADIREAHLASGREPWTRRAAIVLRSAFQAEEVRS